jgi:hypothetical protein
MAHLILPRDPLFLKTFLLMIRLFLPLVSQQLKLMAVICPCLVSMQAVAHLIVREVREAVDGAAAAQGKPMSIAIGSPVCLDAGAAAQGKPMSIAIGWPVCGAAVANQADVYSQLFAGVDGANAVAMAILRTREFPNGVRSAAVHHLVVERGFDPTLAQTLLHEPSPVRAPAERDLSSASRVLCSEQLGGRSARSLALSDFSHYPLMNKYRASFGSTGLSRYLLHPLDACFIEMSGGRALLCDLLGFPLYCSRPYTRNTVGGLQQVQRQHVDARARARHSIGHSKDSEADHSTQAIDASADECAAPLPDPDEFEWRKIESPELTVSACILDAMLRWGWDPNHGVMWMDRTAPSCAAHTFLVECAVRPWCAFWFRLLLCWGEINWSRFQSRPASEPSLINALMEFPHMGNLGRHWFSCRAPRPGWGYVDSLVHSPYRARLAEAEWLWFTGVKHGTGRQRRVNYMTFKRIKYLDPPVAPANASAAAQLALCAIDAALQHLATAGPACTSPMNIHHSRGNQSEHSDRSDPSVNLDLLDPLSPASDRDAAAAAAAAREARGGNVFNVHALMSRVLSNVVLCGGASDHAEALWEGMVARSARDGDGLDLTQPLVLYENEILVAGLDLCTKRTYVSGCMMIEKLYADRRKMLGILFSPPHRADSRMDALVRMHRRLAQHLERVRHHRESLGPTLQAMKSILICDDLWPTVLAYALPSLASQAALNPIKTQTQFHPISLL